MSDVRVANYKIKLNGTEFSQDLLNAVEAITVEDEINLPTMFCIQINMIDSDKGKWRGIDLKTIKPGDKVAISIGIDNVENIVSGEITSL
jgi:phage protein D